MPSEKVKKVVELCEASRKTFIEENLANAEIDFSNSETIKEFINDRRNVSFHKVLDEWQNKEEIGIIIKLQRLWVSELNRKIEELESCSENNEEQLIKNFIDYLNKFNNTKEGSYHKDITKSLEELAKKIQQELASEKYDNNLDNPHFEIDKAKVPLKVDVDTHNAEENNGSAKLLTDVPRTSSFLNLAEILNGNHTPTVFKQTTRFTVEGGVVHIHHINPIYGKNAKK